MSHNSESTPASTPDSSAEFKKSYMQTTAGLRFLKDKPSYRASQTLIDEWVSYETRPSRMFRGLADLVPMKTFELTGHKAWLIMQDLVREAEAGAIARLATEMLKRCLPKTGHIDVHEVEYMINRSVEIAEDKLFEAKQEKGYSFMTYEELRRIKPAGLAEPNSGDKR